MFGFAEWDSWLSFVLEAGLSLAVVVGLFFLVRRVNASAEEERRRRLQAGNELSAEPATDEDVKRET